MENSLDTRIQHAVIGDTNNAGKTTATDDKPLRGEIVFNNTLTNFRVGINGNTAYSSLPDFLHVFTGANTSHAGTSGLVLAPSQKSSGDPDKFLCDDGSWKAVSSSGGTDTTYKFYLNGTLTYGSDSGGTNLSSPDGTINGIYAPITSGTSGNMLKSNGNNSAPTWDSLENIIGKKTANYVLAGNGTASGNGVVSWQQLSLSSLSDAPNTGTLTLNGTGFSVYSPTASLSKTWYAPESAGSQYNLLVSNGSGAPSWILPNLASGQTTGLLKYTSSSGWSFDSEAYVPESRTWFYATVGSNTTSWGHFTKTGTGGDRVTFVAGTNIGFNIGNNTLTINYTGSAGSNYYHTPDYSNGLKIGTTTGTTTTTLDNMYVPQATVNSLGVVKLGMANVASGTFAYPSGNTGYYAPLQIDSNGRGRVWEPSVASVNGCNPGLLQVTADANPGKVYINTEYATAIPVFYSDGSKENVEIYIYDKGYDGKPPYSLPKCYVKSEEKVFTGHYVNLEDVINGLIRRPRLLAILKDALDNYKPEE